MLLRQSESGNRTVAVTLVTLFLFSILGAMAPPSPLSSPVRVLEDAQVIAPVSVPEQTYELYLDSATSETGGQGSITTIEPNGGQEEGSAIDGLEFRSAEMISDLYINDVLPPQFEIKDWELKSASGKRDDVTMTSEDGEGGLHIVWHVPKVEKGERLEVSFDIKGSGEVDAEALNRFHGVHFGDEIESDDLPAVEPEALSLIHI